jgi:hypothetical protein
MKRKAQVRKTRKTHDASPRVKPVTLSMRKIANSLQNIEQLMQKQSNNLSKFQDHHEELLSTIKPLSSWVDNAREQQAH